MIRTSLRFSLLLLLPFLLVVGCGDDTPADPGQAAVIWTRPNAGSTFTYDGYEIDSNGVKIDGSGGSYTDSVLATGVSARGVSNLVRMTFMGIFQVLLDHRSNGDLAMTAEELGPIQTPWTVFPIGRKGTIVREAWSESTGDSSTGITTYYTPYTELTYLGAEQRVTPAGTFATHRVLMRTYDTTSAGDPYITNDTSWYAPSIGTYVRQSRPADMVDSETGRVIELQSYVMK